MNSGSLGENNLVTTIQRHQRFVIVDWTLKRLLLTVTQYFRLLCGQATEERFAR